MDIGNIIAIITSIIAAGTSVFAIKISLGSRRDPLGESLYNRQLDVYQTIFTKMIELEDLFFEWMYEKGKKNRNEIFEEIEDISEEIGFEFYQAQLIIPQNVAKDIEKLLHYFDELIEDIETKRIKIINVDEVSKNIFKFETYIRELINLEQLNYETEKVLRRKIPLQDSKEISG